MTRRHRNAPIRAFLHHALRRVVVALDGKAADAREIEEEQHVAAGERGDERLLGSTPAGSEKGIRTTLGDDEAGTTAPPSNAQPCARLYCPVGEPLPACGAS